MRLSKLFTSSLALLLPVALSGCGGRPAPNKQAGAGQTVKTAASGSAPTATTGSANDAAVPIAGDWQFGFQFNNSTLHATVHLDQQGNSFSGTGTDDETKKPFKIEQGSLESGNQVSFYKKYDGNLPEIQYTGTLENANEGEIHGPYMHGDYATKKDGKIISNIWEAALTPPGSAPSQPAPQAAPDDSAMLDRTPELSGKWNVGYEYNFKTAHAIMFIEATGDRIVGHGSDRDTGEKFVIEKGWYHYPHLTLVWRWPASSGAPASHKGKGKGKAKGTAGKPERTMIFKAEVKNIHDSDYTGPYLNGKTQGGGEWQAQMFK
ncbi:MAG TPA: hypothetical protein V6C81_08990 [Planktothrix sp.]|jgi:hypothetical protein